MSEAKLDKRTLRTMRDCWQRDYDRLEKVYGGWSHDDLSETDGDAYIETMRNLATAIAWIDGMIASKRNGGRP